MGHTGGHGPGRPAQPDDARVQAPGNRPDYPTRGPGDGPAVSVQPGTPVAPGDRVRSASAAVHTTFIGSGVLMATWASRIPQVRDRLQLEPSQLGLVLLAIACGSVLALPLSGPVIARVGTRRTVIGMALLMVAAMGVIAVGYLAGTVPVVVGLFLLGFSNGAWDVAANVQGALVEVRLERSVMARYHAGWSLGTVGGALLGTAMVSAGVPVTAHLLVVAVAVDAVVIARVHHFLDDHDEDHDGGHGPAGRTGEGATPPLCGAGSDGGAVPDRSALAAWRKPRTLLIGVVVLAFAFAEGAANDWISVAVIDGYGLSAALGALAFATFLAAMTTARWFGSALLGRYGRVPVVRVLALVGIGGVLVFVLAPTAPLAFVGAGLWGVGTALGFPVGMSAGADEPRLAAGRVSVISSIGYCAFLAGPPVIGLVGNHATVLRALVSVAVLLGFAALLTSALRPPTPADPPRG